MVRFILVGIFISISGLVISQEKIISGEVVDTSGYPLVGLTVGVEATVNSMMYLKSSWTYTDMNGLWAIKLDPKKYKYLHFNYPGYLPKAVRIDTQQPMKVIMDEATALDSLNDRYPRPYQPSIGGHTSFQLGVDFNTGNYDGFRQLLGDINTDFLNNTKPIIFMGLGYEGAQWAIGFNIGFTPAHGDKDLVEKVESDNFFLDLNMGRKIIDARKWKLKPVIGFRFFNYNMTSTILEEDAPLAEYLDNREIELNFSQPFGFLGLDLEYKFQINEAQNINYWSIGCYGNYQFKLKNTPYLSTQLTRLESEIPIDFSSINWGVSVRMYFGSRI